MVSNQDYVNQVASLIIEQLKQGTAPWVKPWAPGERFVPYNASTGKAYQGMNAIWLMSMAETRGYSDARWLTYKQAQGLDAQVNKGEKGTVIQYWQWENSRPLLDEQGKPVLDEAGQPQKETYRLERPLVRSAVVFNAAQVEGLSAAPEAALLPEWERQAQAEAILKASGAVIHHQTGNRAFYRPSTDSITLPERGQFSTADAFYATALHELGHWTGHASRLNRDLGHPFGSEGYAKEELRAEIASLMMGEYLGIGHDPGQHVAYIASWIKSLEEDPREIFKAAADAEKIQKYIRGFEQVQTEALHIPMPVLLTESETRMMINNERVYLAVPYAEKEQAKALGAKWDRDAKAWYAPAGTNLEPLEPWMPKATDIHAQTGPDPREAFAAALREAGLLVDGLPNMDGQLRRVQVDGDKAGEKSGAYVGFLDGHPAGYIQNFKTGLQVNWKLQALNKALNAQDRARLAADAAQKRQERAKAQEQLQEQTALLVDAHWTAGVDVETHPYLSEKGVQAYGIRQDTAGTLTLPPGDPDGQPWSAAGNLLIPLRDIDGKLWGAQSIDAHGRKSFPRGGRMQGCHHGIGEMESDAPLLIVEGYATGASLHALTGYPVAVAFHAGNLPPVAQAYRQRYPERALYIAGDNDHAKPLEKNVGRQKAEEAAALVAGIAVPPAFGEGDPGTDWNDVCRTLSREEAMRRFQAELATGERRQLVRHMALDAPRMEEVNEKKLALAR